MIQESFFAWSEETSQAGGFVFIGKHLIEGYSARHQSICLSSGEAELHGVVNGSARALWLRNVLRRCVRWDWSWPWLWAQTLQQRVA